ncbi:MAG TPA: endonuclease domain-containing protein [Caulobacteraceae bacterium]
MTRVCPKCRTAPLEPERRICDTCRRPRGSAYELALPPERLAALRASQRARSQSPAAREKRLVKQFGITLADFDRMLEEQEHRCAICRRHEDECTAGRWGGLEIDHDHLTNRVRGLLCRRCNHALGLLDDDAARCLAAVIYLRL